MNAVIYARFSSHNQNETSIEGQIAAGYELAKREGWSVVGVYIDRAISGRTDDRPDFQRMIEDAAKKQFQRVIVWKTDRFARNRYDSALYKHKLKTHGVKVVYAAQSIGEGPESVILESLLEGMAEYYSLDLAKNIKRGLRTAAEKGQFVGGRVPIGYKSIGKALVIDEEKAPHIKWAFEQYAAGVPKSKIIAELNARGLRNQYGRPLSITAFQKALKSEKYIGILRYQDIVTENGCPALVDRETWEKVQIRLEQNRRAGAQHKAKTEYLLYGKLFCGHCGARMIGDSGYGRHGKMFHYYTCFGRKSKHTCQKKSEKKDFIEWYVVEQTIKFVLTPQRLQQIAAAVVEQYDNEFNDRHIKDLERRITKLDRDIQKYTEMLLEAPNKAARDRLYENIEKSDAIKADLEIDLSKLRIANNIRYTQDEIVAWLDQFCKGDLMDEEFRRRIIDTFINAAFLYDDRVVIFYNVKGTKQISYMEMRDAMDDLADPGGSDTNSLSPPKPSISEPPYFVFVNGLFGCVFPRKSE